MSRSRAELRSRFVKEVRKDIAVRIPGGPEAPGLARETVRRELGARLPNQATDDAALLVTELVGNSVRHAGVSSAGHVLVDIRLMADRLRISVADHGSATVPRIGEREPDEPGGLGLVLVDRIASSWGVARDGSGTTRVWFELSLNAKDA